MPKNTNPATIVNGVGQEPFTQANYRLIQTDPVPPPTAPAINPSTILRVESAQKHDAGVDFTFMLASHVQDPHAAHPASAISVEETPATPFTTDSVQGALGELASLRPPQPAGIGLVNPPITYTTGISDWGTLKLQDEGLPSFAFSLASNPNLVSNYYPYYWTPPIPGNRTKISQLGYFEPPIALPNPAPYTEYDAGSGTTLTDQWNAGGTTAIDDIFNIADPVGNYSGGGVGLATAGAFSRSRNMVQTYRAMRTDPLASVQPVVVTGTICPADRGVVALIHWPADGDMPAFLAQPPREKVIAAILLGQGLYNEGTCPVDGEPGGLFVMGSDANGYNPYAFPGQATGQAGLAEIYRGVATTYSDQTFTDTQSGGLNYIFKQTSPYWNFDNRVSEQLTISATLVVTPFIETQITVVTPHNYKVGQPITVDNCPDINGGAEITATVSTVIGPNDFVLYVSGATNAASSGTTQRITGCDRQDYDPVNGPTFPGQVRFGTLSGPPNVDGVPILGAPYLEGAVRGTDTVTAPTTLNELDNNFFQYRLPVLDDYSNTNTGLKYTPLLEKPRYFQKPPLSDAPATPLTIAGNYLGLSSQDYYPMQVARFRHRFEVPVVGPNLTDAGSYMLMHFKKELYFEDLVINGIWPSDDKLYSANIVNAAAVTAGTEGLDDTQAVVAKNMIDQTVIQSALWGSNGSISGRPFFALCNTVVLDQTEATVPTAFVPREYTLNVVTVSTVTVSGISYLLPRTTAGAVALRLDNPTYSVGGLFGAGGVERTFQTGMVDGVFDNQRILNRSPMLLTLGDFSSGETHIPSTTSNIWTHWQRFEFDLEAIAPPNAVGGFAPLPAVVAALPAFNIRFDGDADKVPIFSSDAKLHGFVRNPLFRSLADMAALNANAGGFLAEAGGDIVLFHSATPNAADNPQYGNFVTGGAGTPALASTMTATKDVVETFTDETYRYRLDFGAVPAPAPLNTILGPGLPAAPAAIEVPVRAGISVLFGGVNWPRASWIRSSNGLGGVPAYQFNLTTPAATTLIDRELQVGGLPHRNPPVDVGAAASKPAAGILLYPKLDYTTGYRPDLGTDGVTQFDYSAAVNERSYVRAFDCAFSRSATPVAASGQPFFLLRVDGVRANDFAYAGGGTPGSASMAILVKVPGLTTWMDAGRVDGAGPNKQDPLLDGAGCVVLGPDTFEAVDQTYGHYYCQIKVNVGPFVNLFQSVADPQCAGEVPVLVKVVYYDPAVSGNANQYDFLYDFNTLANNEDAPPTDVRGIIGLQIVRPA